MNIQIVNQNNQIAVRERDFGENIYHLLPFEIKRFIQG